MKLFKILITCFFLTFISFSAIFVSNYKDNINNNRNYNYKDDSNLFVTSSAWTKGVTAAFYDPTIITKTSLYDSHNNGINHFMLAFMQQNPTSNTPNLEWASTIPYANANFNNYIANFTQNGGSIGLSFGGSNGSPIWNSNFKFSVSSIADSILRAANFYNTKNIDFDIEGNQISDISGNLNLAKALNIIKQNNSDMRISLTIPVIPTKSNADLPVNPSFVTSLKAMGTTLDFLPIMNGMAMDFASKYSGDDAKDVIDSINEMTTYLYSDNIFPIATKKTTTIDDFESNYIGCTPMYGNNDTQGQIYTLADNVKVSREFAATSTTPAKIAWMSGWSGSRDYPGNAGPNASGISNQFPYQFETDEIKNFGDIGLPKSVIPSGTNLSFTQYITTQKIAILSINNLDPNTKLIVSYQVKFDSGETLNFNGKSAALIVSLKNNDNFTIIPEGINNSKANTINISFNEIKPRNNLPYPQGTTLNDDYNGLILPFNNSVIYKSGDLVSYNKNIYYAKYWTQGDWSSTSANFAQFDTSPKIIDDLSNYGYSSNAINDLNNNNIPNWLASYFNVHTSIPNPNIGPWIPLNPGSKITPPNPPSVNHSITKIAIITTFIIAILCLIIIFIYKLLLFNAINNRKRKFKSAASLPYFAALPYLNALPYDDKLSRDKY